MVWNQCNLLTRLATTMKTPLRTRLARDMIIDKPLCMIMMSGSEVRKEGHRTTGRSAETDCLFDKVGPCRVAQNLPV